MTDTVAQPPTGCPFSHPSSDFSPWQPDYVFDPYPSWAWFRTQQPVFYSEQSGYWCISRHDTIKQLLLEPEKVSAHIMPLTPTPWPDDVRESLSTVISSRPVLSNLDGEPHDKARRFLRFAFTPRRLGWVRPHVEEIVDDCLHGMFEHGTADLVADFCEIAPLRTLMCFLGFPDEMHPQVKVWSRTREMMLQQRVSEDELRAGVAPLTEYYEYARQRVAELERDPGEDYMSELIQQWHKEKPADVEYDDLVNILITLMAAGHQTTADLSANGFRALLMHLDQWAEVCADPGLVPAAVDEMIRYEASVPSWRRVVLEDIEIEGHVVPAGSKLLMFLGSANHDEAKVAHGDRFDIHRADGRQYLTFGAGRHYCLGQPLAKLELTVMTERLTAAHPDLRLVEGIDPTYRLNIIHRGPDSLPVTLDGLGANEGDPAATAHA